MVLREQVDAHVEILEPIEPESLSVDELRDESRRRIAVALGEM